MINFPYLKAELTRRRSKTVLISIGLAVPIALVILIGAYSSGLSNAQDRVLKPLVGLGTDMTVGKTFTPGQGGAGGRPRFSLGSSTAGKAFSRDTYTTGFNGSFSSAYVRKISNLSGVKSAVGGLTVNNIKASTRSRRPARPARAAASAAPRAAQLPAAPPARAAASASTSARSPASTPQAASVRSPLTSCRRARCWQTTPQSKPCSAPTTPSRRS